MWSLDVNSVHHWKQKSSQFDKSGVTGVVKTTYGVTSEDKFVKFITFFFQWLHISEITY